MKKYSYIGSGSFGCVVKPAYICHNNKEDNFKNINTITKLFPNENNWKEEIYLHNIIQNKIDPNSIFTIKMLDKCIINPDEKYIEENIENTKNFYKCKLINKDNKIYQIIYEDGGINLEDYIINNSENIIQILYLFINILEGVKKISLNNYIHFDIKNDNILYNYINKKLILIDFGKLTKKDDAYFYDITYGKYLKYTKFLFFPPEFNMLYYAYNNNFEIQHNDNLYDFINYIKKIIEKIIQKNFLSKNLKNKIIYIYNKLLEYYNKSNIVLNLFKSDTYDLNKITTKKEFNLYIKDITKKNSIDNIDIRYKIDVYMVGINLLSLILLSLININSINDNNILLEILDLIFKMIDINPFTRISIENVIIEYKKIFSI